jgi:ferredoxin-NADP reductase
MNQRTPSRILSISDVTHDTRRFVLQRPEGFDFQPGQATEISLDQDGRRDDGHPFTFTSLPADANLEFVIKRYPEHDGMTQRLHQLKAGDNVLLKDVFGAITYKGPGVFLAGGAGVTPFIAILRQLERDKKLAGNTLIFSNKTQADIIEQALWQRMLGDKAIFTLTREHNPAYHQGRIDAKLLQQHVKNIPAARFYLCGPDAMVKDLSATLKKLGASAESLVIEA